MNDGHLYLRAAAGLLPKRHRSPTLPDRDLVDRGVAVDRAHLAAYDRVCGFRLTDTLPATYLHVLAFPLAMRLMTANDFPFPVIGLVHIANRITVSRPVDAGERLDLSVRAADLRDHGRGRQFDIEATATVDGEEVWRGVSTYLRKDAGTDRRPRTAEVQNRAGAGDGGRPREAGERPPATAVWRVPAKIGREYAAVSGDRNPIHTSRLGARLLGFPGPIAHGMWSKARCLAALAGRLPAEYTVDVVFRAPIRLPGTVSFRADGLSFEVFGRRPHLAGQVTHP